MNRVERPRNMVEAGQVKQSLIEFGLVLLLHHEQELNWIHITWNGHFLLNFCLAVSCNYKFRLGIFQVLIYSKQIPILQYVF